MEEIYRYDIYKAIEDGATLVSCLLVEPIAYNFKGVECLMVRRRTIERINDPVAVKFLLNRFIGNDLGDERKSGVGKLDENTEVKDMNKEYFNEIVKQFNI